ncbi:hypothetical protein F383_35467 [Gossypium arboreum]|uniref:Uncharacterized protein n=1 Tax=Gossypium arboreum TaxID=29729 RepID=A0A0B0N727_GOSAR|nr:hypothetical protein F383_35467 [Gossypium arboreum]
MAGGAGGVGGLSGARVIWGGGLMGPKIGLQQLPLFAHCRVIGIEQKHKERPILPSLAES